MAPDRARSTVFLCRNVWVDPPGRFLPQTIVVSDGRVVELLPPDAPLPEGPVTNLGAAYLMPGLINTHVHLELSASSLPRKELETEPAEERVLRAISNARAILQSGVTTIRDCGSSFEALALARRPDLHPYPLPRLVMAGPAITVPHGHMHDFGGEAADVPAVAALIDRLIRAGTGTLKLMGSGGGMTPGTMPETVAYPQAVFDLIAQRAREAGLACAVHVLATESIRRAARAGFDSLEHCAFFERDTDGLLIRVYDSEVAEEVARSGAAVMPNLSTATRAHSRLRAAEAAGDERAAHDLRQFDRMVENFGRLLALGIPMVCGTDAGVRDTGFDETWRELVWMTQGGMSDIEAIRAASLNSARVIGMADEVGRIAPGFRADFVALERSPLEDIAAYRSPQAVFLGARRVFPAGSSGGACQ